MAQLGQHVRQLFRDLNCQNPEAADEILFRIHHVGEALRIVVALNHGDAETQRLAVALHGYIDDGGKRRLVKNIIQLAGVVQVLAAQGEDHVARLHPGLIRRTIRGDVSGDDAEILRQ